MISQTYREEHIRQYEYPGRAKTTPARNCAREIRHNYKRASQQSYSDKYFQLLMSNATVHYVGYDNAQLSYIASRKAA